MTGCSSRSTNGSPKISSSASPGWEDTAWASSPISRQSWQVCSTSMPQTRPPDSCASATPSTSRSSLSSTFPVSCRDRPRNTGSTRQAYGGAYDVMSSKHIRGDLNLAWPTAELAVMGPEGAVSIIFRKELAEAEEPEKRKAELVEEYREKFANPYVAASRGYLDDVIEPRHTRPRVINALEMLSNKRDTNPAKKHGNIPL